MTEAVAQSVVGPGGLQVAVRVGDAVVPAWIIMLLDAVADSASTELVAVTVAARDEAPGDPTRAGRGPELKGLSWLDERLFGRRATLFAPEDLMHWADRRGIRVGEDDLAATPPVHGPSGDVQASAPQIVVDLSGRAAASRVADLAGREVWWLAGLPTTPGRLGAGYAEVAWSVIAGSTTLAVDLLMVAHGGTAPAVFATGVSPVHPCSPLMTAVYAATSALQLIVGELEKAGRAALVAAPRASSATEMPPPPESVRSQLAACERSPALERGPASRHRAFRDLGYAARSARWGARRLGWVRQWCLLIGDGAPDDLVVDPLRLRPVVPPAGHFWADPHLIEGVGTTHVLFEDFEFADRKGRISALTLDSSGRPGPARRVLEADTHLSYPFVFRYQGRLFMIPESAEAGSVDLYECTRVPDEWRFRRTLLTGVRLVDATLVEWQGLWWMFACVQQPLGLRGADLLVLYYAEDPVAGDWRVHPASPVAADVRGSRPAGAPFVRDGRLYRPAQDGSGGYGWGIAVKEVLSLTTAGFAERRVGIIKPPRARGVCGIHTLNRAGGVTVMDACRWVPRSRSAAAP
jgi:hypothetical protein